MTPPGRLSGSYAQPPSEVPWLGLCDELTLAILCDFCCIISMASEGHSQLLLLLSCFTREAGESETGSSVVLRASSIFRMRRSICRMMGLKLGSARLNYLQAEWLAKVRRGRSREMRLSCEQSVSPASISLAVAQPSLVRWVADEGLL